MTQLSPIAIDVLRFAVAGRRAVFLGHGVIDVHESMLPQFEAMSNAEYRELNLRVLRELVDAGLIRIKPEPGIPAPIDGWSAKPEDWISSLSALWPVNEVLSKDVGFWLTYEVTDEGTKAALAKTQ